MRADLVDLLWQRRLTAKRDKMSLAYFCK